MDNFITLLNTTGKSFVDFSISMLIQSSVLIIVLLLLDLILRKKFRAVFLYCIWVLVLVKLVLPTTLSSPTSLGYWFGIELPGIITQKASIPQQTTPIPQRIEPVIETIPSGTGTTALPLASPSHKPANDTSAKSTIPASPATVSSSWQSFVFLGWLVVVIAMVLLLIQRTFLLRGLLAQSKNPNDSMVDIFERCRKQMGVHRSISLKLSLVATSPSVCGLFRPTILIPQHLPNKLKADDLRSILLHELAHIKRGDLWISLIQTILQITYFYHPLVWVANTMIRKVREQAVDEMVLVAMGEQAEDYAETLLNISRMTFSQPILSLRLIGVVESRKALHRRIKQMLNRPIPQNAKLGIRGLMTIMIFGAVLLPMAKAQKQSVDNTAIVSDSDKNGSADLPEAKLKTSLNAVDSDGDGLSDFQEIHKYLTDPAKRDTDGDGVPDGDWNERREYTYSVRTILQFMPPFDKTALNDDYQDARVLKKTDDYIEIEVIHYPLATPNESIEENPNWQRDYAGMTEYLQAGITTNWDTEMKQDLLVELKSAGIRIDELTDKEVVEQVSSWLMKKSKSLNDIFTTYYVHFPNGRPSIYPGLEDAFNRHKGEHGWTVQQQFEHELLGKDMFYNKTHGTCTSFAIYLTTMLRALDIPTRMVIVVPVVDASNKEQLGLVKERIAHNKVRETMLAGLRRSGKGFTAHTFNEVYVGNRWHRLNYNKLGQPILDPHLFGLHTHLYTFTDWSEADLTRTWGWRYAKGQTNAIFKDSNPYSAVTISDLFGCHSNIPNPPFAIRDLPLSYGSKLPNIYILSPSSPNLDFSEFKEIVEIVKDAVANKTGRYHKIQSYDEIFIDGIWGRKTGDIIVLIFSLDTKDRIPETYEDLLPRPWAEIEADLRQGKTVEQKGKARDSNIILLAAPKREQLRQLIRESELLRLNKAEQVEGRKPPAEEIQPSPGSALPNIYVMSPSGFDMFGEIFEMVRQVTYNKTGRLHDKKSYDSIFIEGIWGKKSGDIIVLLFSLDSPDRIPTEYEDLLPKPWPEIEATLKQNKTVELRGEARELNVILLAAPTSVQLRSLVQESELLNLSAKPSESSIQTSGSSATLPNGLTVELLGVCEHPSEGKQWWRPDGSFMKEAPYKSMGSRLKHHEGYSDYEFVMRPTGPSDTSYKWEVPGSRQGSSTGAPIGKDGNRISDLRVYTANQGQDKKTASVRIGVTAAKWQTLATHVPKDREETYSLKDGAIAFGVPYEKGGETLLPAVHNFNRGHYTMAIRVIAITHSDEQLGSSCSGSGGNVLSSLTYGFNEPLANIREFQFQTRPYTWVEFRNISLEPGMITNVQHIIIEGNMAPDEMP